MKREEPIVESCAVNEQIISKNNLIENEELFEHLKS